MKRLWNQTLDRKKDKIMKFMRDRGGKFTLIYKKRKDKVFRSEDEKVFIKFVFTGKNKPREDIMFLMNVAHNPSPFLMEIMYNDYITNSRNSFYHIIATANAGLMSDGSKIWSQGEFLACFHDLSSGLLHLHDKANLCHRDIHKTNYVRNPQTGRWTLIDFDLAAPVDYDFDLAAPVNDGVIEFLIHSGFKNEHHPALLLAEKFRKPHNDISANRLLASKYSGDPKSILRLLDIYQLWLSILVTSRSVDEKSLPLLEREYFDCEGNGTEECDLKSEMITLISRTEQSFRVNHREKAPDYDEFYETTVKYISKINTLLNTNPSFLTKSPDRGGTYKKFKEQDVVDYDSMRDILSGQIVSDVFGTKKKMRTRICVK